MIGMAAARDTIRTGSEGKGGSPTPWPRSFGKVPTGAVHRVGGQVRFGFVFGGPSLRADRDLRADAASHAFRDRGCVELHNGPQQKTGLSGSTLSQWRDGTSPTVPNAELCG